MGHGLAVSDPGIWFWWIGAGLLLIIELMSGTFYLLMIAVGFLLAGVSRLLGASGGLQVLVAAVLALSAVAGVRIGKRAWRRRQQVSGAWRSEDAPALTGMGANNIGQRDPSANLDIGASVWVDQWTHGRARVSYRGSQWDALLGSAATLASVAAPDGATGTPEGATGAPGWYRIHQIDGIRLILLP